MYQNRIIVINYFMVFCTALWLLSSSAYAEGDTPEKKPETGLFGSHEIMSHQLSAFKKWNSMLARNKDDFQTTPLGHAPCRKRLNQKCYVDDWHDFLAFLKDKPKDQQISEINIYINNAPYITDIINWGIPDYWASLLQFLRKDGDCEDYAIAKYLSLKELGFDADMMRIVVVQDTNLNIAHAVLVVTSAGDRLILDNQISFVVKEKAVLHYKPYYSINENAWWLHNM
ncbi:MAG: transglutaminase-like cysteine peptidase [Emcibacter sp.]|nr:transglutaminase-like cysteine peptidase [Emcibacter sp.]